MRSLLACLLVAACSGPAPSPSPPAPTPPPPPTVPAPPETPRPEPSDGVDLTWSWRGPPLGPAYLSQPPASVVDPGGLTCRFAVAPPTSTLECVETRSGARRWGFDLRDRTSAATLLRDGDTLYHARYERNGFGAIVERTHLDRGERPWRRVITGLPVPIGGLPVNAIELTREDDALIVRGWDAGGRWAVALDRETGAVVGSRVFEGRGGDPLVPAPGSAPPIVADLAWQWDGPPPDELRPAPASAEIAAPEGGRCRWRAEHLGTREGDRSTLECVDLRGQRVFGYDDASWFASMTGRALAIDGATLYVLSFHRAASGATMTAYELATGVERWSEPLDGLGPIVHSAYAAFAQLRIVDGRPVAFGWESAGRYIEVLDPATGTTVWHRRVE